MKAPTIAITSSLGPEESLTPRMEVSKHASAIERAGGSAVVLYTTQDPIHVLEELNVQGILLSGGGDISASRYGGDETLANDYVDIQRDAFEYTLLQEAFAQKLPILAVCRGMQLVNVALGGTLIEDLRIHLGTGYRLPHNQIRDVPQPQEEYTHDVIIAPHTRLHAIVGRDRCRVNSFHHQAIRRVAPSLHVVAQAEDGVAEAVEFVEEGHAFFIGVQWHPERLPDDPAAQRLYNAFLEPCRRPSMWGFQDANTSDSVLYS